MDAISIISLFLFKSIWFTIYYYLNIFLHMFKIFPLTEQYVYVQLTYRNLLQKYVLYICFTKTTWTILWGSFTNFLFE